MGSGSGRPVPSWLGYAVLSVACAIVLAWRWHALAPGSWEASGPADHDVPELVVLAMAGVAVA